MAFLRMLENKFACTILRTWKLLRLALKYRFLDYSMDLSTKERDPRWELVSNLALWFVWQARCRHILEVDHPRYRGYSRLLAKASPQFEKKVGPTTRRERSGYRGDRPSFNPKEKAPSLVTARAQCTSTTEPCKASLPTHFYDEIVP